MTDVHKHPDFRDIPINELDIVSYLYNSFYVQLVLNLAVKNLTDVRFIKVSDLTIDGSRQVWEKDWKEVYSSRNNIYLRGTDPDVVKNNLAKDIVDKGSYWAATITNVGGVAYVVEGAHRVSSLQQYYPDYKLLCVNLKEYGGDSWQLKIFPPSELFNNPEGNIKSFVQMISYYLSADNLVDGVIAMLSCSHGLELKVHEYKDIIKPSPIINNELLFNSIVESLIGT